MRYLRLILLPFSWIYAVVVFLRNLAYDFGLFKSKQFDLPVISVGNLAVGGAGKSPMTEYLVNLLKDKRRIAVLSRGYGRKTRGFRLVSADDVAALCGDEPLQFKRKFKDVTVAVCEKRVHGIEELCRDHELVVLDDAYQHRAVRPGLNILLFDYTRMKEPMLVLPAGNLREPYRGRKRADLIVVTKTPPVLLPEEREQLRRRIGPRSNQRLFFSYLRYGNLIALGDKEELPLISIKSNRTLVFLLTGIANPRPLLEELRKFTPHVKHYEYPDHHPFSRKNISKLAEDFSKAGAPDKLIVTTEKDAQRLLNPDIAELLTDLPVYYLPIRAEIHEPDKQNFDHLIENYVSEHLQHSRIH
ncbi:tetraacyldisaccharide 4'-kinase [Arcticibacter sp. MXS-1]|uniref:tetraacyldisaccharide 4'-kinase n=1 Tax=Arcticibacter sp. MXS-1 TaxID=3341726 RepID=UPI0035A8D3A4